MVAPRYSVIVTEPAANDGHSEAVDATKHLALLVVHHQALFREGLRALLAEASDIDVVAEAGTVSEAVRLDVTPDVILADSVPPDTSEENVVVALGERFEAVPVILVGPAEPFDLVRAIVALGGMGYITTTATVEELVAAARAVARGELYLQPSIGIALAVPDGYTMMVVGGLTPRETEVLRLLALGHTNSETAQLLSISLRTIETHRAHIQQKLGVQTRAGLVRVALDTGLLVVDGQTPSADGPMT